MGPQGVEVGAIALAAIATGVKLGIVVHAEDLGFHRFHEKANVLLVAVGMELRGVGIVREEVDEGQFPRARAANRVGHLAELGKVLGAGLVPQGITPNGGILGEIRRFKAPGPGDELEIVFFAQRD